MQPLPVLEARVLDGARRRDAGGEHRHVHAAEGQDGLPEGADDGRLVRHVHAHGERVVADLLRRLPRAVLVDVREHDVSAQASQPLRGRPADAAGSAGDERHAARHLLLRRHLRELVALERPVLDAERLPLVEGHEAAHRRTPFITVIARWYSHDAAMAVSLFFPVVTIPMPGTRITRGYGSSIASFGSRKRSKYSA